MWGLACLVQENCRLVPLTLPEMNHLGLLIYVGRTECCFADCSSEVSICHVGFLCSVSAHMRLMLSIRFLQ
jgi:hypothetical protein